MALPAEGGFSCSHLFTPDIISRSSKPSTPSLASSTFHTPSHRRRSLKAAPASMHPGASHHHHHRGHLHHHQQPQGPVQPSPVQHPQGHQHDGQPRGFGRHRPQSHGAQQRLGGTGAAVGAVGGLGASSMSADNGSASTRKKALSVLEQLGKRLEEFLEERGLTRRRPLEEVLSASLPAAAVNNNPDDWWPNEKVGTVADATVSSSTPAVCSNLTFTIIQSSDGKKMTVVCAMENTCHDHQCGDCRKLSAGTPVQVFRGDPPPPVVVVEGSNARTAADAVRSGPPALLRPTALAGGSCGWGRT